MSTINLRLSGSSESIDAALSALRALPDVDRLEEMGTVGMPRMSDDSSSAGLPDDARLDARDVEIHAVGAMGSEDMREGAELAARDADVVIEWLEPF